MEDLNSGKIMYVFVRISDPKTSIKKNILINWQASHTHDLDMNSYLPTGWHRMNSIYTDSVAIR